MMSVKGKKIDADAARILVWEQLRKVAKPDSRFSWNFSEFITDYVGSDKCAEHLCEMKLYKEAKVIFITPDNNLAEFRKRAIEDKKVILMTNYGITRGVFLIKPGSVPEGKEELASTLDGVQSFWKHLTLAEVRKKIGHIDILVTGASAITTGGVRFGKGHGYFDLEWAMFYTIGVVENRTPVIAVGHDCQVIIGEVESQPYDTVVDYIVTPSSVIKVSPDKDKPDKGIIWTMLSPGMLEQIPPLQELWAKEFCK